MSSSDSLMTSSMLTFLLKLTSFFGFSATGDPERRQTLRQTDNKKRYDVKY